MSVEGGKKRYRSINFTPKEKILCMNIAQKYRDVIENKRTDGPTCRFKNDAWDKIVHEFNVSTTNCIPRTKEQLKKFYENKKTEAKLIAKRRGMQTFMSTGQDEVTDPSLDIALSIISTGGDLNNTYDGDGVVEFNFVDIDDENIDSVESVDIQQLQTSCSYDIKKAQIITDPPPPPKIDNNTSEKLAKINRLTRKYEEMADMKQKLGEAKLKLLKKQYEIECHRIQDEKEKSDLLKQEIRTRIVEMELRNEQHRLDIGLKRLQIKKLTTLR